MLHTFLYHMTNGQNRVPTLLWVGARWVSSHLLVVRDVRAVVAHGAPADGEARHDAVRRARRLGAGTSIRSATRRSIFCDLN